MDATGGEARKRRRLISGFDVEGGETRMVEAVAADEINYKKHQERASNHDGDGNLKTKLKVAGIRDFPHKLRP